MRRKLYSSRRVKKEGLVYTRETERDITAAKCDAAMNHVRSAALIRVITLAERYRSEHILCLN